MDEIEEAVGFAETWRAECMASRWISAKDGFPPDNRSVLVWHDDAASVEMAYRENGAWRMSWTHYQVGECEYTHWMPLPKGPQSYDEEHGK